MRQADERAAQSDAGSVSRSQTQRVTVIEGTGTVPMRVAHVSRPSASTSRWVWGPGAGVVPEHRRPQGSAIGIEHHQAMLLRRHADGRDVRGASGRRERVAQCRPPDLGVRLAGTAGARDHVGCRALRDRDTGRRVDDHDGRGLGRAIDARDQLSHALHPPASRTRHRGLTRPARLLHGTTNIRWEERQIPARHTALTPGSNSETIRRDNLSTILREVHLSGPRSRSDLVAVTGLNRSTVGDLVLELAERRAGARAAR